MKYLLTTIYTSLFLTSFVFAQDLPYPKSAVVEGIQFDWSTHIRLAPGSDNWPLTWADNDKQYTVWGDGGGFGGSNSSGRSSMGVAQIDGPVDDFEAINLWGGFQTQNAHKQTGKSYGIICVDGILYMWVGMLETEKDPFGEVKLAWSADHGASWQFTDWSFFRKDGVMMPTFCNFSKNNGGARDEFVYSYLIRFQSYEGPDDYPDKVDWLNCQKPGLIDLVRAPKDQLLNREAYRFYSGMNGEKPLWTKGLTKRQAVFENKDGVGWCMSAVYNQGIKRYLLVTEHTETHRGKIGIFDAPEPWGPWTVIYYENNWGMGQIPVNTFCWNFSNKWTSPDGKHFSLIFSGRKENDSFNLIQGQFITTE